MLYLWKGTILEGIVKCWVTLADSRVNDAQANELRGVLEDLCMKLAAACPSVVQEEYQRLLALDREMFDSLLDGCMQG